MSTLSHLCNPNVMCVLHMFLGVLLRPYICSPLGVGVLLGQVASCPMIFFYFQSEGWGTVVMLVPAPVSGTGLVPLVRLFVVVVAFRRGCRMPELMSPFNHTPCIMYSNLSCTRFMWLEAAGP